MEKELEVKVLDIDFDVVEKKIKDLGGELIADERQENILIDSSEKPIKDGLDGYLRIRETEDLIGGKKASVFTLKKQVENENLRENVEISTEVEDKDNLILILKSLGFDKVDTGYKDRKSYKLKEARIDMDTWDKDTYPYPYMEIEVGDEEELQEIIQLLELPKDKVSNKSILQLKEELNS